MPLCAHLFSESIEPTPVVAPPAVLRISADALTLLPKDSREHDLLIAVSRVFSRSEADPYFWAELASQLVGYKEIQNFEVIKAQLHADLMSLGISVKSDLLEQGSLLRIRLAESTIVRDLSQQELSLLSYFVSESLIENSKPQIDLTIFSRLLAEHVADDGLTPSTEFIRYLEKIDFDVSFAALSKKREYRPLLEFLSKEYSFIVNKLLLLPSYREAGFLRSVQKHREALRGFPEDHHQEIMAFNSMVYIIEGHFRYTIAQGVWSFHDAFSSREKYLASFEDFLSPRIELRELSDRFMEVVDFSMFETPLPPRAESLREKTLDLVKVSLLPLKNEVNRLRSVRQKESKNAVGNAIKFTPPPAQNVFDPFAPPKTNPNKRKSKSSAEKEILLPKPAQPDLYDLVSFTTLSSGGDGGEPRSMQDLSADQTYHFQFLRQRVGRAQMIRFMPDALESLKRDEVEARKLLKAVIWGHTSRSAEASSGIKMLHRKGLGAKNLFEARPGDSAYRMILTFENGTWIAHRIVHKNDFDRVVDAM